MPAGRTWRIPLRQRAGRLSSLDPAETWQYFGKAPKHHLDHHDHHKPSNPQHHHTTTSDHLEIVRDLSVDCTRGLHRDEKSTRWVQNNLRLVKYNACHPRLENITKCDTFRTSWVQNAIHACDHKNYIFGLERFGLSSIPGFWFGFIFNTWILVSVHLPYLNTSLKCEDLLCCDAQHICLDPR